ncbi:MAG: radical SAM protein [Proteobacteria bacterium]|nr:radical SAM protein [Pseudomonadota bacterium]MBU1739057.1 radical SAM protein [Pseudomonadota bacterium]
MHYEGNIIRPPSEADSIILQVTVGCSHNRCSFCGTYRGELFRLKKEETILEDIEFAARYCGRQKRVFLADGDVLSLPQRKLVHLFSLIREKLPFVNRIALYGNAKNIIRKSQDELAELKELGLARVYMGLESGNNQTLQAINKGVDAETLIRAGKMIRAADLFLSVTVLLGVAGKDRSCEHARDTGKVISAMEPSQVGVLTLMLLPGTPLSDDAASGRFSLPDKSGLLAELALIVKNIDLHQVQFQANHASNYLPVNCRLPRDREKVLAAIEMAQTGAISLKPEYLRAL